jgi:hypothetical protein
LTETYGGIPRRYREGIFGAISAGFFFLLIGIIFAITPNLFQRIIDFLNDFGLERIPNTTIYFIAPARPLLHRTVYQAAEQFSYANGFFQIVILALRFFAGSPWNKKAETVSNFVFGIGAGYLIQMLLIEPTIWTPMTTWFVFWAAIIMLLGISLIIRAIILGTVSTMRTT